MSGLSFTLDNIYMPISGPLTTAGSDGETTATTPSSKATEGFKLTVKSQGQLKRMEMQGKPEKNDQHPAAAQAGQEVDLTGSDDDDNDEEQPQQKFHPYATAEGSLNGEFSGKEILNFPELFAQSQRDQVVLKPVVQAILSTPFPTESELEANKREDEDPAAMHVDRYEKEVELVALQKDHPKNAKFADAPSIWVSEPPDIPVLPSAPTTAASKFFEDVPLDGDLRLSGEWLRSIDRAKVIFAAAPEGFQLGKTYSLQTRFARAFAIGASVVASTLKQYGYNWILFVEFCRPLGRKSDEIAPADPQDVEAWLSTFVDTFAASTVRRRFDAISFYHIAHGLEFKHNPKAMGKIFRSAANAYTKTKDQRPGISVFDLMFVAKEMERLAEDEPSNAGFFCSAKAAILLSFFGMARLGEITMPVNGHNLQGLSMEEYFNPKIHLSITNFTYYWTPDNEDEYDEGPGVGTFKAHVPWTKTSREKGKDVLVGDQRAVDTEICPVLAIQRHFQKNKNEANEPAFTYVDRDGRRKWLTFQGLINAVNAILEKAKKQKISGHSFRIGGHDFYTVNMIHPDHIRTVGRWGSNAVDAYMRAQHAVAMQNLSNIAFSQDQELAQARPIFFKFYGLEDGDDNDGKERNVVMSTVKEDKEKEDQSAPKTKEEKTADAPEDEDDDMYGVNDITAGAE